MYIFDVLGLNSFNWKNRHVSGHHNYSNIMEYDPDIQQSPVVKIFPQDKTQVIIVFNGYICLLYMPFLYLMDFYRDFKDIFRKVGGFINRPYPFYEVIKMIVFQNIICCIRVYYLIG